MKFKEFVKLGITLSIVLLVGIVIMAMSIFALDITNAVMFTNVLMILMIIVQLLTVSILIYIYEALKGGRRK